MPTLQELHSALEAKTIELGALPDDAEHAVESEAKATALAADIEKIEGDIKRLVDAVAKLAEAKSKALASASTLNTTATTIPFSGRVEAGTQQADATKSFADWLKCVGMTGSQHAPAAAVHAAGERLNKVYKSGFSDWSSIKAAMSEQTGITGGYVAPPEYSNELLKVGIEDTLVASRARQFQMGSAELHIPMLNQTATPTAGQTAFTGGMVASWTGEAATRSETEPNFKQITLRANELSGYTVASRNILADNAVALENLLQMLIRDTVAWYTDYGCLQGDGVSKPLGILNAPALLTQTRATATTVKLADAVGMLAKLMPASRKNAIWVAAIDTLPQIATLLNSAGNPTYLPQVGTGYGQAGFDGSLPLLGRPVYFTEKLPALGTKGDLLLIDPSYYLLGTRQALEVAASDAPGFTRNQMYWRFVARLDAQPWVDKPFTLQDGTRQVSPFIALL